MKQPFRYCRGEFTRGAYLKSLVICPNLAIQDVVDELVYQACFQWKLEDEAAGNEMPVRDTDIINIAKIAGLFQPRTSGRASLGSLYFSQSHIVNSAQRSERGLVDMDMEGFSTVPESFFIHRDKFVRRAAARKSAAPGTDAFLISLAPYLTFVHIRGPRLHHIHRARLTGFPAREQGVPSWH